MNKLEGKTALVTGASRGIGRAIALRMAQEGAIVAVHYRSRHDAAEEVVSEIERSGGSAFALASDLTAADGVSKLYAALDEGFMKRTGSKRLDILVNNAGIGQVATIEETNEQAFAEVMDIHVKAPFFVIQQALPRLNEGGRIINISSSVTRIPFPNLLSYSMSKAAINTLTYILAQHLGSRSVTVNAILPGIIDTEMNKEMLQDPNGQIFAAGLSVFGKVGQPQDVASIAAFLASSDGCWITGQLIDASGGSRL
jgi:NAD(P)-dependent dehydrogenase (short-subunit alcohol dehydrogenase family)